MPIDGKHFAVNIFRPPDLSKLKILFIYRYFKDAICLSEVFGIQYNTKLTQESNIRRFALTVFSVALFLKDEYIFLVKNLLSSEKFVFCHLKRTPV